jgi:hypothetical protein
LSTARSSRLIIALLLCVVCGTNAFTQHLKPRIEGERLRVSGPQLNFLTSRALERLQNGVTVTYTLQMTARAERAGRVLSRVLERFRFSYDLWEEKYSVTRLSSPTRSASNLSVNAVEAWCLDNLSLPVAELPSARSFWITLEYETEESRDLNKSDSAGLTLSGLIDIFSRRPRNEEQIRGLDEVGPFRVDELRKK